MRRDAFIRLARFFPPAWRRRYGPEMEALLEDMDPEASAVVDVLLAAGRAWLRSLVSPARAALSALLLVSVATVLAQCCVLGALQLTAAILGRSLTFKVWLGGVLLWSVGPPVEFTLGVGALAGALLCGLAAASLAAWRAARAGQDSMAGIPTD
jgi:hypothetical protein